MTIVSYVVWRHLTNGKIQVAHTFSKAFRKEEYARELFDEIVESMRRQGVIFEKEDENREVVRGVCERGKNSPYAGTRCIVYIDWN